MTAVPAVHGADIRVLCPPALRTPIVESARAFARSTHHRVEFIFAAVAAVHKRVATGEHADVAIGTVQGADALVRLGRGVPDSVVPLARSALALVLPAGEPKPDPEDAAALALVLRRAQRLLLPDAELGVPGGAQSLQLLERLGLREQLRPRTRYVADVREIAKRLGAGEADIGIAAMSDIGAAEGIAVVGPIAEPRTDGIVYAAVIARNSAALELARDFIAHLRLPESQAIFAKAGFLPPD